MADPRWRPFQSKDVIMTSLLCLMTPKVLSETALLSDIVLVTVYGHTFNCDENINKILF